MKKFNDLTFEEKEKQKEIISKVIWDNPFFFRPSKIEQNSAYNSNQ